MADSYVDLEKLYQVRFPAHERLARERLWQVLCADFFSRYIRPTDTVLDLACGYGEFINAIGAARRIALDINPDSRRHLAPGVTFFNQSCEQLDGIADESVDVVFESNLFEHFPSKTVLTQVVRDVRRKLRPGGRFIMLQPNIRYVGDAYWDFYDHFIPLTHLSCAELLQNCQFTIERMIPRFLPYTTKSALPQHPALVRLYLRVPLVWRVLGKQFLIVAVKPAAAT
jgi:SAM-dependent methyltransferase